MIQLNEIALFGQTYPIDDLGLVSSFGYFKGFSVDDDQISDHASRALKLLIEQFEKKPNINEYFRAFLKPLQAIEDVFQDMKHMLDLNKAVGHRLDIIGELVGIDRNFLPDSEYRDAIKLQIILNASSGEFSLISTYLKFLLNPDRVHLLEEFPAGYNLNIKTNVIPLPVDLKANLEKISLSGVRVGISQSDGNDDFAFDEVGFDLNLPDTSGFNETWYDFGGSFVEIF